MIEQTQTTETTITTRFIGQPIQTMSPSEYKGFPQYVDPNPYDPTDDLPNIVSSRELLEKLSLFQEVLIEDEKLMGKSHSDKMYFEVVSLNPKKVGLSMHIHNPDSQRIEDLLHTFLGAYPLSIEYNWTSSRCILESLHVLPSEKYHNYKQFNIEVLFINPERTK